VHGLVVTPPGGGTVIALVQAAELWASTAKTGRTVLTGRWGGCRVLVIENDQVAGDGKPTHWLMLGDAEHGRQPAPARRVDQAAGDGAGAGPDFLYKDTRAGDDGPGFFHEDTRPRAGDDR
jgi:hypothetical protein